MFVVALIVGAILLRMFAAEHLIEENEPVARSAERIAGALNTALLSSANPQQTLDAFAQSLGTTGVLQFRRAGAAPPAPLPFQPTSLFGKAPGWFVDLLAVPEMGRAFPIMIDGSRAGDILFEPTMSADIFEKWIGFLAILFSRIALALLTGFIAHVTAGAALRPLRDLGQGLTRLRQGNYGEFIPPAGPPEIRRSAEEANALAQTLSRFEPGQPQPVAQDRIAAGRRTAGSGAGTS